MLRKNIVICMFLMVFLTSLAGAQIDSKKAMQGLWGGAQHDPKTGNTTYYRANRDGTRTIFVEDSSGKLISEETRDGSAGPARVDSYDPVSKRTTTSVQDPVDDSHTVKTTDQDGNVVSEKKVSYKKEDDLVRELADLKVKRAREQQEIYKLNQKIIKNAQKYIDRALNAGEGYDVFKADKGRKKTEDALENQIKEHKRRIAELTQRIKNKQKQINSISRKRAPSGEKKKRPAGAKVPDAPRSVAQPPPDITPKEPAEKPAAPEDEELSPYADPDKVAKRIEQLEDQKKEKYIHLTDLEKQQEEIIQKSNQAYEEYDKLERKEWILNRMAGRALSEDIFGDLSDFGLKRKKPSPELKKQYEGRSLDELYPEFKKSLGKAADLSQKMYILGPHGDYRDNASLSDKERAAARKEYGRERDKLTAISQEMGSYDYNSLKKSAESVGKEKDKAFSESREALRDFKALEYEIETAQEEYYKTADKINKLTQPFADDEYDILDDESETPIYRD